MPWQGLVGDVSHEIDPATGELWYREVVVTVPRQSGKTTEMLAVMVRRALGHQLPQVITYTAQSRIKAREKWEDEHIPILDKSPLKAFYRVRKTTGNEAILWRNGSKHSIEATTEKAGHGPTLDLGVIDEAFAHPDSRVEQAMKPAMITRPSAQLWILSTAGTAKSAYLRGKVNAGRVRCELGMPSRTAYFDWSAPDNADPADPATWYGCMPALGIMRPDGTGVSEETIRSEFESMELPDFRRAYLNQWLDAFPEEWLVISAEDWDGCADEGSQRPSRPVAVALDVMPRGEAASIAVAGARDDGRVVGEIPQGDHRPGTDWCVARLLELRQRYRPVAVIIDPRSPAASLIDAAEQAGLEITKPGAPEVGQAFGLFYVAVADRTFCHLGKLQPDLRAAVAGAVQRDIGDGMHAWARKNTSIDLSPLVAVTLATWGYNKYGSRSYDVLNSVR
jgi:phage terminase large subunit-like protein